jgi:hypothetical protein
MRAHALRLVLGIAVTGLLCGLSGVTAEGGGKKEKGKGINHPAIVAELHQSRLLLHNANHDYDGYRAKAMHDVGKAMHALDPKHKHELPKESGPAVKEDQKKSDAQLATAAKQIQVVIGQLTSAPATPATTSAVKHLEAALGHLNTALKIK